MAPLLLSPERLAVWLQGHAGHPHRDPGTQIAAGVVNKAHEESLACLGQMGPAGVPLVARLTAGLLCRAQERSQIQGALGQREAACVLLQAWRPAELMLRLQGQPLMQQAWSRRGQQVLRVQLRD